MERTKKMRASNDARPHSMFNRQVAGLVGSLALAVVVLAACGDDGNGGGEEDTLFTGLSGLVIFGLIIYFVWRKMKRRG